jgi:hypothetical protein
MHSANCTKEAHLQNKSTDDESCDELKLQGENLEARREKAPGRASGLCNPGIALPPRPYWRWPFAECFEYSITRYSSCFHGII